MKAIFCRVVSLALGAAVMLVLGGCDEPNTPDVPLRPYSLAAQYFTQGIAADVEVYGNLIVVSEQMRGAVILDVSDPRALDTVFVYTVSPGGSCVHAALDPLHSYLCVFPPDLFYYSVFDYRITNQTDAQIPISLPMNGPLGQLRATAEQDTLVIWGTDETASDNFFTGSRFSRPSETSEWEFTPLNQTYVPANGRVHGFDIRADGVAAIAIDEQGIHLHRTEPFEALGSVDTPGQAHDCAWSGNLIVVADEYQMVLVDASDLMAPQVIAQFRMTSGDRLRRVAVDGPYACLMDLYDGIFVVDISHPTSPKLVQELELYDPTSVTADGGRLYVTDQGNGLVIYTR
ncbi:MAG: hypothetical protein PHI18_03110 [bacterium]|nr:hypothetical protein [bacterium]